MPAILNLKFKGNKSFVPFSNLSDIDSLTKTWKVCTKVASFLEQGQRLENLSWRLWHLQNLMVDSDNARSKREFKRLSKHMGDKLDKEKGRSIAELEAPGFRRNHSTDMIQQRAAEKERNREASLHSGPGTIQRMQFTFSVDQPTPAAMSGPVQKPDLKPSAEFNKPARRTASAVASDVANFDNKEPSLTQRGRKTSNATEPVIRQNNQSPASLRFPTLFSNDFDPRALYHPTPSRANPVSFGEGLTLNNANQFDIIRPTIELPLDELLTTIESPGPWSSATSLHEDFQSEDVDMKPVPSFYQHEQSDAQTTPSPLSNVAPLTPLTPAMDELPPLPTINTKVNKRPSLSVKTQNTRSSNVPSASLTGNQPAPHTAPGGVKAECSNCGATHTPLWRRGLNDELNCNACGLYCKLHKRPRPKNMRNAQGEGRSQNSASRQQQQQQQQQETTEVVGTSMTTSVATSQPIASTRTSAVTVSAQCYNCHTTATPLWRKDDEGKTVCNACGLYYKLHGSARPISMKSDVIRKRSRHDARRANGIEETPSASPGASRRTSPVTDGISNQQPTLSPDSTTQMSYDEAEFRTSSQSELMGALGDDHQFSQNSYSSSLGFNTFPGPYHPDYLSQNYLTPSDPPPFSSDDHTDEVADFRANKRRRMSTDSASEPPSSAVSGYSSYAESYSTGATSATPSRASSMDFPYNTYSSSFNYLRGTTSTLWHPPMLLPDGSPQVVHPPMSLPEESPMDFLHPPMLPHEDEALFAAYIHPPMALPDSPPVSLNSLQLQHHTPSMTGMEYAKHDQQHNFYESMNHHSMHTY